MKLREAHFMQLNSSTFRAKDDSLLKMALEGDQKALDLLLARYRRLLYDLALRMLRNHEEAEDAVQSCLLLAYRNLSNVKCERSFRSWLVRILINEALAIVRKKKSRPAEALAPPSPQGNWLEGFPAGEPDPEQALSRRESVGNLIADLIRLPVPLRSPIILCDIGEHGIEQASAVLGLAPNTMKVRLHRGKARIGLATRQNRASRNVCDVLIGV
jgi:RNA polymerase sigma-70 factor (ECF subfamily)